jgi:tetratricopeptide (TPR) repeat protein
VWLVADWGTGQEGFLSAALERLNDLNASHDIFHLRCDEATDINSLESLFPQQFAYPVQTFCRFVGSLPAAFLILDAVHPALCAGEPLTAFRRFADAIAEYCPQLRLVVTSGSFPENTGCPTIQLHPLDVPDLRTYLTHHPDATPEIREPDIIEQLHERAEGLPMHVDRLIKAMRVSSPPSVLEADREESITTAGSVDQSTPEALVYAVNTLVGSADVRSNRSLELLKVLSLLPYGETLEALHHFLPTQPFFPENALQLEELTLLDIIPLQQTTPRLGTAEPQAMAPAMAPKLLKVPRPVRDYVVALLTDAEKDEIVRAGIEKFFGRAWRYGKVKLRSIPLEYREYLSTGAGNEFALIHQLIVISRARGENAVVTRAAALALQYCHHLMSSQRFHDLEVVAGALLQLMDQERHPKQWTELAGLYGAALRMTGKRDESLTYLRAALESGETQFSDSKKASIWMDVALAEDKRGNIDDAVAAAEHVKLHSKGEPALSIQASALIAQLTISGPAKIDALTQLEKEARLDGNISVANGILLDLYSETSDPKEELRYIDKILKTEKEGYQRIRAIVAKAQILVRQKKECDLRPTELVDLAKAYTYLHAQRFGALFDHCHSVLWDVLEIRGDSQRLLRLFRHSSFLWRLRGREEQESNYLKRLSLKNLENETRLGVTIVIEFSYFKQRLKVVLSSSQQPTEPRRTPHTQNQALAAELPAGTSERAR